MRDPGPALSAESVRTIHLRKDESIHVDAQVVIIRTVRWVDILQRYVIEYEVGR